MKYETQQVKDRDVRAVAIRCDLLIKEGWTRDSSMNSDGTYYYQTMRRETGVILDNFWK